MLPHNKLYDYGVVAECSNVTAYDWVCVPVNFTEERCEERCDEASTRSNNKSKQGINYILPLVK